MQDPALQTQHSGLTPESPPEGLEIAEDLKFQGRIWTIQRIGWIVMVILIIGALLGLFGRGPLSQATASDPTGSLRVQYERFSRYESSSTLRIWVRAEGERNGVVRVRFDPLYFEAVQVEQVMPVPESGELLPNGLMYLFRVGQTEQPTVVTFHLKMHRIGFISGHIALDSGRSVNVRQFVYP